MFRRLGIYFLIASLSWQGLPALAAPLANPWMPKPGTMVGLSPAFVPVIVRGLKVYPEQPFRFDLIVDSSDTQLGVKTAAFKQQAGQQMQYFLAALTVPKDELWVNLSPYERNRVLPDSLAKTLLGRDMLAQDYVLKQVAATLIYPEKELGKRFWDTVYTKAQAQYGTTDIPINTFNKVWAVADRAKVFVKDNTVLITEAHMKVMLESDYVAMNKNNSIATSRDDSRGISIALNNQRQPGDMLQSEHQSVSSSRLPSQVGLTLKASQGNPVTTHQPSNNMGNKSNETTNNIIQEIILPALEIELNEGKNFAPLRQMYNSIILATWYKNNLKAALINQVYANQNKTAGIGYKSKTKDQRQKTIEQIYQMYLQSFKKGVFNYISTTGGSAGRGKEDSARSSTGQAPSKTQARRYFSGGFKLSPAMIGVESNAMTARQALNPKGNLAQVAFNAAPIAKAAEFINPAMVFQPTLDEEERKALIGQKIGGVYLTDIIENGTLNVGVLNAKNAKAVKLKVQNALKAAITSIQQQREAYKNGLELQYNSLVREFRSRDEAVRKGEVDAANARLNFKVTPTFDELWDDFQQPNNIILTKSFESIVKYVVICGIKQIPFTIEHVLDMPMKIESGSGQGVNRKVGGELTMSFPKPHERFLIVPNIELPKGVLTFRNFPTVDEVKRYVPALAHAQAKNPDINDITFLLEYILNNPNSPLENFKQGLVNKMLNILKMQNIKWVEAYGHLALLYLEKKEELSANENGELIREATREVQANLLSFIDPSKPNSRIDGAKEFTLARMISSNKLNSTEAQFRSYISQIQAIVGATNDNDYNADALPVLFALARYPGSDPKLISLKSVAIKRIQQFIVFGYTNIKGVHAVTFAQWIITVINIWPELKKTTNQVPAFNQLDLKDWVNQITRELLQNNNSSSAKDPYFYRVGAIALYFINQDKASIAKPVVVFANKLSPDVEKRLNRLENILLARPKATIYLGRLGKDHIVTVDQARDLIKGLKQIGDKLPEQSDEYWEPLYDLNDWRGIRLVRVQKAMVKKNVLAGSGLSQNPTESGRAALKLERFSQANPVQIVPGGIDFNERNLTIESQGKRVQWQVDQAQLTAFKQGRFTGLNPVLISITPLTSFNALLGLNASK